MLYIKHYLRYIHNIKDYSTIKCHAGEESPRRPNSRTAEQPEQLPPLPSASPSPVRFRPLPSGFPVRIRLKLLIITANYLPGSSPFFFAAAVLPSPLRE